MTEAQSMRVRNRRFDLESDLLSGHWNDKDPCLTHTFSVASLVLEVGEAFLVEYTAKVMVEIIDTDVRARAKIFAGQESNHRFMHVAYNDILTRTGWRIAPLLKAVQIFINPLASILSRRWLLACLVSVEYLAALTAERLFDNKLGKSVRETDSAVAKFWRWHLAEEAEHRLVMHETYCYFGGGIPTLVVTTWGLAVVLYLFINVGIVWLVLTGPAPKENLLGSLFNYNFGTTKTFFWLPYRLLIGTWQRFDPARLCRNVDYVPHLDNSSVQAEPST